MISEMGMKCKHNKKVPIIQATATKSMWLDEWLWRLARMRELESKK